MYESISVVKGENRENSLCDESSLKLIIPQMGGGSTGFESLLSD